MHIDEWECNASRKAGRLDSGFELSTISVTYRHSRASRGDTTRPHLGKSDPPAPESNRVLIIVGHQHATRIFFYLSSWQVT